MIVEWAGKEQDTGWGSIRYTKIHAWVEEQMMCGGKDPWGDWISEQDSNGDRCRRCEKALTRHIM